MLGVVTKPQPFREDRHMAVEASGWMPSVFLSHGAPPLADDAICDARARLVGSAATSSRSRTRGVRSLGVRSLDGVGDYNGAAAL